MSRRPCGLATCWRSGVWLPLFLLRRTPCAWAAPLPRPSIAVDDCPCQDPLRADRCYQPVCPPGYYKCCATCSEATCYGSAKMYLSWRGLPECIECESGDFCSGCDVFERCPDSTQPNRAGPRISTRGANSISQCESCPRGLEASFDRGACMPKYSALCNLLVVSRCIRNCKAEDPVRGKHLTPCERMKCTMYCSKRWSDECSAKVAEYCIFATTLVTNLTGGIEAEEGQGSIAGCNVDCNAAFSPTRGFSVAASGTLVGLVFLATSVLS